MINWIHTNEPLWLFVILIVTGLLEAYVAIILTLEYFYDKEIEEKKTRRVTKRKVKVVVDKEGNARIAEAPKGLDISIEHEGA